MCTEGGRGASLPADGLLQSGCSGQDAEVVGSGSAAPLTHCSYDDVLQLNQGSVDRGIVLMTGQKK